jgi:bifunctional non-homologous end joining protein LigD
MPVKTKSSSSSRKGSSRSSGKASRPRSLAKYKAKRDFTKSPEPSGSEARATSRPKKSEKQLMFCVQKHLASHLHYDFRLEHRGVLLSWAVPKGPSLNPADKRLAMMVEDHPYDYGDFEGVIPSGYGAGIVMLWDTGTWQPSAGFENIDQSLKDGELKFTLDGLKLKGSWVLVRTRDQRTWLLIKHRDEWSGEIDVAKEFPLSVKSDKDFEDILAKDKPDIWESHKPAQGGVAGKMLQEIIEKAARKKARRNPKSETRNTKQARNSKKKIRKQAAVF